MTARGPTPSALTLEPIGYVRAPLAWKVEAPRQPRSRGGVRGRIELLPGKNFEHALRDLDGWEYLWIIFWFDRNTGWRPKVLPPRSRSGRKGVFATRAPHRPNPLGLSALRLERVDGLTLHVADLDMLDGTPVLDIKPYVAYTDSLPHARSGWLEDTARAQLPGSVASDPIDAYEVVFDALAHEQAGWVEARTQLALRERAAATLALGPEPHPYRRIRRSSDGTLVLAVRDWRVRFTVSGRAVRVHEVVSGYRKSQLDGESNAEVIAHREFRATQWTHARMAPTEPPR